MPMPSLGSILGTVGNVAAAGARMYGSYEAGKEQGKEHAAAMRRKLLEEAIMEVRAQREKTESAEAEHRLSDLLNPDRAAQEAADRERAVAEARAKGTAAGTPAKPNAWTLSGHEYTDYNEYLRAKKEEERIAHSFDRPPQEPRMTPGAEQNYYQDVVDDMVNAAGGDAVEAFRTATRLDSRLRSLVRSNANPTGVLTEADFQAGAERYRDRQMRNSDPLGIRAAQDRARQDEAARPGPTPLHQHPTSAPVVGSSGDIDLAADPKGQQRAAWDKAAAVLRVRGQDPEETLGKRP